MARDTGNYCPRCGAMIPVGRVACRDDWYALPQEIRNAINLHFIPKQTLETATGEYLAALEEALEWFARHPKPAS